MKKTCLLFVATLMLVLTSYSVTATEITDLTGDVYHHKITEGTWIWEKSTEGKPEIDITKISYDISGNALTVTLQCSGNIQDSMTTSYALYYNTSKATYMFSYSMGIGVAWGISSSGEDMKSGTFTASGNTLTGTIEAFGDETFTECWSVAFEYSVDVTQIQDINDIEYWADYVPGSFSPWDTTTGGDEGTGDTTTGDGDNGGDTEGTGGDNGGGKGTPGFEVLTIITALAIAFIILRRKH